MTRDMDIGRGRLYLCDQDWNPIRELGTVDAAQLTYQWDDTAYADGAYESLDPVSFTTAGRSASITFPAATLGPATLGPHVYQWLTGQRHPRLTRHRAAYRRRRKNRRWK